MLIPLHSRLSNLAGHIHGWLGERTDKPVLARSQSWLGVALGLWLILNWALPASALTVQDIPNPRVHGGWISDTAEQISAPMERRLNGLITFLEAKTATEIAVVTIPDTPPEVSPKDFATDLFNTWGVGKAEENNGVLLLLSMGDRRIEIELGRGMNDVLSDDRLASLLQDTLRPLLQSGNVDQALWAGVGAIVADLTGIDPNVPLVLPWASPIYVTFFVLGIVFLVGSILNLRWQYQKLAPLPPTGSQSFRHYSTKLKDIDFDRLVRTTSYRPKRPFFLLLILACSFPLIASALAFWVSSLWVIPFDTRTDHFLFLTVLSAIAFGWLLPLYLDPWLHPDPGNPPFNLLKFLGIHIEPEMTWRDLIIQGAFALGTLSYIAALIGGGTFLLWLLYSWLWTLATLFTPTLKISVGVPLFVALGNGAIAAYYLRETRWLSRPTPGYCCETCQGAIIDVASQSSELRELLPYRPNTTYRAWRCPVCHPTLSQDGIFLFTEKKTPSSPSSLSPKSQRLPRKSRQSTSYDYDDPTESIPPSSSSDFGGGSSDGGGVGDNW